jgi:hypothetical protein
VESKDSTTSSPPGGGADEKATTAVKVGPGKSARQLSLDDDARQRSYAILKLFWPRVEPVIGGKVSHWKAKNSRAALSLARLELSDADLLAAHDRVSERLGEPAYVLAKVLDEFQAPRGSEPSQARERSIDGTTEDSFPLFEDLVAAGIVK